MLEAKPKTKIGKYFHYVPWTIMAATIVLCVIFYKDITVDNIKSIMPANLFLAALLICAMFAVKALSVMFPGTVLYVLTGMIFPTWAAFIVAVLGTVIEIIVSYFLGVLCGEIKMISNLRKKPKFQKLFADGEKNENILVYLSRIIGLPYDIMGMFWGAVGAKFLPFVFFSILGKLPKVVIETFIGTAVDSKINWQKIVIFIALVIITLVITLVSNKIMKKKDDNKNNNKNIKTATEEDKK